MLKMDAKIRPYEFETLGEALGLIPSKNTDEAEEEAPPPPPTFSEEELQQKAQESFQQGLQEGIIKGRTEAEDKNRAAIEKLSGSLEKNISNLHAFDVHYTEAVTQLRKQLPGLVIAAAKKVAGGALKEAPLTKIEEALSKTTAVLLQKPEVAVSVHSSLADTVKQKLEALAKEKNMATKFTVVADDTVQPSDIRFEWKDGGVATNTEKMWQDIEKILEESL